MNLKRFLPSGKAFGRMIDPVSDALSGEFQRVSGSAKSLIADFLPSSTSNLVAWESQFNLRSDGLSEQERRDKLAAAWSSLGGSLSPSAIQAALQSVGFDVYVHEWWEPDSYPPAARVPRETMGYYPNGRTDEARESSVVRMGYHLKSGAYNGIGTGVMGSQALMAVTSSGSGVTLGSKNLGENEISDTNTQVSGIVIVNDILEYREARVSYGDSQYGSGFYGESNRGGFTKKIYDIPTDTKQFPYTFYICGKVYGEAATVDSSKLEYFVSLVRQISPLNQYVIAYLYTGE